MNNGVNCRGKIVSRVLFFLKKKRDCNYFEPLCKHYGVRKREFE